MTSTLPLFPYCVLFVNAAQRDIWMENVKKAAGEREVLIWAEDSQPTPADPENCVVLIHELSILARVRVSRFCAIFTGLSQVQSLKESTGVLSYPSFLPAPVMSLYTEQQARKGVAEFAFFDIGRITVPSAVIETAQKYAAEVDASKLAMYVDGYTSAPKTPLYFEPADFKFGAGSGLGAHEWIDITGVPRELVSGPGICPSKGTWEIVCRIDVDAGAVGMPFGVEWGTEKDFESTPLMFDRPGIFELSVQHPWVFPAPAKFRFVMKNSSLGGIVGFLGGELRRI